MTGRRLLWRTLRHYWSTGLCVALGLAVAAAVITGSLVIGDSVRGSIRDTALSRLGRIGFALQTPQYFGSALAGRVQDGAAAIIVATGSLTRPEDEQTLPHATVIGVTPDFWQAAGAQPPPGVFPARAGVNAALAQDLGLQVGDTVLLNVQRPSALGGDTLFSRRTRDGALAGTVVEVAAKVPPGLGDFRLDAQTAVPRNVFVDHDWLAEHLGQPERANAVVVGANDSRSTEAEITALNEALRLHLSLDDLGLKLRVDPAQLTITLNSQAMTLTEAQVESAQAALPQGLKTRRQSVYLATRLQALGATPGQRESAYSMVAALEGTGPPPGEVWLNDWVAADLQVRVGDRVRLSYLVPTDEATYPEADLTLRVSRVVPIAREFADRALVPEVPGVTDAASMDSWNAPFPVDMNRVTPRDEAYWERHRATPKAFVHLDTARAMWRSAPGQETADWVTGVQGWLAAGTDLRQAEALFAEALREALVHDASAPRFVPVRQMAIQAARGTSDFGQLFLGLSMFIVASGLALSGLLLRLSLERRASQAGLLLACGWTQRQVGRLLAAEGVLLSVLGVLLGVPAGVAYADLLITSLTTRWSGALGMTSRLWLHVELPSLVIGALATYVLGVGVSIGSVRRLAAMRPLALLGGWQAMGVVLPSRRRLRVTQAVGALSALGTAACLGLAGRGMPAATAFFLAGFLLLVAGLTGARLVLGKLLRVPGATRSLGCLAARNAAAQVGRSLLVLGLLASATFVLVAVATNARDLTHLDPTRQDSGTGGFTLRAVASVPLPADPSTAAGRANLGFSPEDEQELRGAEIVSFLASPGDDISCLNLSRPTQPRLLGVSDSMVERDGFRLATKTRPQPENPWTLLDVEPGEGHALPAFGDASSVQWTLHSGLGKQYELQTPGGRAQLEFAGLLQGSIFQSELLVSEASFRRLYPSVTRPGYFLVACAPDREQAVAEVLRRTLGDYGVEVRSTREILQSFLGVQNAYLAMFLALGGVGLMLGTVGLAILLLRTALERRGQFALLISTGLSSGRLAGLLLLEHAGLLLAGLVWGTLAALVAVAPQLASAAAAVNWGALTVVLSGILGVGLLTCAIAVRSVLSGRLIAALRQE